MKNSQPPICPSDTPQHPSSAHTHKWCMFQVSDPKTAIIEYIYSFALLAVMLVLIKYWWMIKKYRSNNRYREYFGNVYLWVYRVIGLWLFCSCVRVGFALTVFNLYMREDFITGVVPQIDDPSINSPIVILSITYHYFSTMSAFLINLLMLLIPYQWLKIALQIINQTHQIDRNSQKTILTWLKILQIIKYYCKYLRNGFPMFMGIIVIMFFFTQIGRCSMLQANYYFISVQAFLIMLFYIFVGYTSYYLTNRELIRLQKMQSIRIKIQYILIFIVLILRLTRNLISATKLNLIDYQPNGHCSDRNYENNLNFIIILCVHHTMMHLLPVCVILHIYSPDLGKFKKYQNLLDIDSTSDNDGETNYKAIARSFHRASLITENRGIEEANGNSSRIQFS